MPAVSDRQECPHCRQTQPADASRCTSCGKWLGLNDATVTSVDPGPNWSRATRGIATNGGPETSLETGSILAERYEILKLLGEGGMGAVYKARDMELDRLVALKVIRPELAGHPSVLQRFKQELLLARQIT